MHRRNIVHIISSLARGGAEQVLVTLCKHLAQPPYNYHQTVLFFYDGPLRAELAALDIPTVHISAPFRYINPLFYARLYRALSKSQLDVVHSSLWFANFCAKILCTYLRIPLVSALHNNAAHSGYVRNLIDRYTPFNPTRYVAVSDVVAQSHRHAGRIVVIQNGIPEPQIHATHVIKNTYVIGAVGRFIPSKNYLLLINTFAHIHRLYPYTRLLIIGHGPQERELRSLVKKLNLTRTVTFIINKPAQHYYYLLDCFVHPSPSEGCPLSPLEARMHKIPTIVTHDAQLLHHTLIAYIKNPQYAQARAHQEYGQTRHEYSIETMVAAYDHLLSNILE